MEQNASFRVTDTNPILLAFQLLAGTPARERVHRKDPQHLQGTGAPFVTYLCQCAPDLDSVTPSHIVNYLSQRRQCGLSSHTLHTDWQKARAFWNWCLRMELTSNNPFAKVEPPKREQVLKPALTPEEVDRLLQACTGKDWLNLRDRALILLLLDTGLRIHECHQLRVGDVAGETVVIKGKGGKQRVVVLSAEVRLAVQRYLKAYQTQHGVKLHTDSPLWWGASGALTLHGIKLAVRKVGKRAGLRLGAHQLRRTFATWSLRNGMDLERLRLLMGHSDLKTTQQYLSLVEQDLKQAHQQHSPLNLLRGRR